MNDIRRKIFDIIRTDSGETVLDYVFHVTITVLILISAIIVFVGTFDVSPATMRVLDGIEAFASIVFTVEYLLRILTADFLYPEKGAFRSRVRFLVSPMAVIDLVAILPFWLPMFLPCSMLALRLFRLSRLLRLIKLDRYFYGLRTVGFVLHEKRFELLGSVFFIFLMMLVSSLLMYAIEHGAQPKVFRNAFSGLWWAIATLTTVGYGDIYPVTVLGRILASLIAFAGVAVLAVPTGIITAGLSEQLRRDDKTESEAEEDERRKARDDEEDRLLAELRDLVRRLEEKR